MSIPTLLVFKDGQPVKRLVGAKGKGQLLQDLAEFIGLSDPAVLRPGRPRRGGPRPPASVSAPLGHEIPPVEAGGFGPATERRCAPSRTARGLRVDGICGPQTWSAVVESGYRLGDRLLYRRRPMLRGDDVAELQRRLNGLGFDAGREDGILGDDTTPRPDRVPAQHRACPPTACAGAATLAVLDRVGGLADGSVAAVREREALRRGPHRLEGRRVFVAAAPGFETLANLVVRGLVELGAGRCARRHRRRRSASSRPRPTATPPTCSSPSAPATRPGCRCSYYESGSVPLRGRVHAVADAVEPGARAASWAASSCAGGPHLRGPPRDADGRGHLRAGGRRRRRQHGHARGARRRRGSRRRPRRPPRRRAAADRSLDLSYSCARKRVSACLGGRFRIRLSCRR